MNGGEDMKTFAWIIGGILLVVTWLVAIAASLAVPALAVWALGHFAFGWW